MAARIFAVREEIGPPSLWLQRGFKVLTLERGLIAGGLALLVGAGLIVITFAQWAAQDFGPLDLHLLLRPMIIGTTLIALGSQTVLMSFFYTCSLTVRVRQ